MPGDVTQLHPHRTTPKVSPNVSEKNTYREHVSIGDIAPFHGLADDITNAISEISIERYYGAGETIAAAGQFDGTEFFIVTRGSIDAAALDLNTGAMVLERVKAPGVFGLARAVSPGGGPENEGDPTLTAVCDVSLLAIDGPAFSQLLLSNPPLVFSLMNYFASELASRPRTIDLKGGGEQRIYSVLVDTVTNMDGAWRIISMPKHRDLAESAQVSEAEAAAAVAKLIRDGVATRDYPSLIINDMTALKRLAQ